MTDKEIKVTDLMVGDWIKIGNLQYYQVEEIRKECGEYRIVLLGTEVFATENELEPIPLTPEILEKNGFVDILHPRFNERTMCKVWGNYDIQINVDNKSVHMVISPLAAIRNGRADYIFPNPDYVHEFQHILKLLGIPRYQSYVFL